MSLFNKCLIFETSVRAGHVALADGEKVLLKRAFGRERKNAGDLAVAIRDILAEAGWRAAEIDAVIVSLGPGSYTSLRVGMMSAKTLAYANRCPLFGVESFRAIAQRVPESVTEVCVIADALQGTVYTATYCRAFGQWGVASPLAIRPLDECVSVAGAQTYFAGPGADLVRGRVATDRIAANEECINPQSDALLELVLAQPDACRIDPWLAEPIYLRGSSAEEKRKAMG